jgi:hypothetical protein
LHGCDLRPAGALALLLSALAALPVRAAPVTYADPAGLCNGQAPCFTTLAGAVANAGPPPATVFVFPGTYAESVDLGTMGSAIGGGQGELAVVSVDATGQPAPGAVVDAGAPGGPGAGRAIEAISFLGALTLDGLVLRSPDTHGLLIFLESFPLRLSRLVANGNPGGHGILVLGNPDQLQEVHAEQLQTDGNGGSGMVLGARRVTATDLTARGNGGNGVTLAGTEVVGQRLTAENNVETGVHVGTVLGAASFSVGEVIVRGNGTGLLVVPDGSATSTTGTLSSVAAGGNLGNGILAFGDVLTATALAATQNGRGIGLQGLERVEGSGWGAVGNAGLGIAAFAPEVRLGEAVAEDNLTGIAVGGDLVVLADSTASDSGPTSADPFDGAGFVVLANRLEATGNRATDNQVGWVFNETDPFPGPVSSLIPLPGGVAARIPAGGGPLPPQRLTLRRTVTDGNQSFSMGVRLRPQGQLRIACSDFLGNGQPGLDLQTPHTIDARFNFWGDPSGPSHPGNPGGTGDPIQDGDNGGLGTVLFGGFLAGPATDADCPAVSVVEVPVLGPFGLFLLGLALAWAGARRLWG